MRIHEIFFWAACFFLLGVLIASGTSGFEQKFFISALSASLIISTLFFLSLSQYKLLSHVIAVLSLVMFLGAGYYFLFDYFKQDPKIIFGKIVEFTGVITEVEQRLNSQKLVLGNIQITTSRYPEFEYGDKIKSVGVVKKPEGEFANYFDKEGVAGVMSFPKIELISKGNGSAIKAALFKIRSFFETSFKKVLPFEQAAFLSGLTLGSTAEFSDEFKEELRLTGTNHLVALSGYNISIIVKTLAVILGSWWLTRKLKFTISILFVISFVIMTGAEASVVRAAIMAMLILLADQVQRPHYFRNTVVVAALVMVLVNPKVLAFDIGFQLSFAALLGIVYLKPWMQKRLHFPEESGIFNWREHLLNTTSAQLAVLPLLLYHFDYFSPIGIVSNVLILEFVPITMILGFCIGFASIISNHFAWLISFPTTVFLWYELSIIRISALIMQLL